LNSELTLSNLLRARSNSFEIILQHSSQRLVLLVRVSLNDV
jgi:hypothetical protein